MNQIYVSVILTVYNTEKYLTECISSIINQSLNNIEIIIINDGSTDKSLEIINNFAKEDFRIKVINQKNLGAAVARNNGILIANGKYLSILDGDDTFDNNMLESMYLQAEKNGSQIIVCPYRNLDDIKEIKRGISIPKDIENLEVFSANDISEQIFQISNPAAWSKLFRKDFILNNNIKFQDLKTCNDLYFTYFALSLANKISILNKSFVIYRNQSFGAISHSRGEKFTNIFKAMNQLKKSLIVHNLYDHFLLSFYKRALSNIMYESKQINKENIVSFSKEASIFLKELCN